MIKMIAFDLDGTLFDPRQCFEAAFPEISKLLEKDNGIKAELSIKKMREVLEEHGADYKKLFDDAFAALGMQDQKIVAQAVKIFHSAPVEKLRLYPDTMPAISALSKLYSIAIVTEGSSKKQKAKIIHFGLDKIASFIIYAQDLGYSKPNPKIYKELIKMSGLKANEILVVGDNPFLDFPGAKITGMRTCRIIRGEYSFMPFVKGRDSEYAINDLKELIDLAKKL